MKLFGSKRKSKHAQGGGSKSQTGSKSTGKKGRAVKKKKNVILRVIIIILAVIAALAVAAFAYWKTSVKPPDVQQNKNNSGNTEGTVATGNEQQPALDNSGSSGRTGDKYTFAVLGLDDGNGNTDTIMVGTFDTTDYTLDIVSIPRDTLVNVSWSVKKANTLYAYGGADGAVSGLSNLLGYDVDFYAIIGLNAFEKLIDAVGGIEYNVPQNMKYDDPAQDLYINLSKGLQTLNGEQSMWVMRFRNTYAEGDIKRIEVQQDFLKTAVTQILSNTSAIPITTLADIVINDVQTNLTYGNIIWFAKELFKMDAENVNFHMLPGNTNDSVYQGSQWVSYVTIYVDEWLEMINQYLNPYDEPIEESDLDILTRNSSGALYATSGVRQGSSTWGSSSGSKSSGSSSGSSSTGSGSSTSSTGSSGSDTGTSSGENTGSESGGSSSGQTGNETQPAEPEENTGGEPENETQEPEAPPESENGESSGSETPEEPQTANGQGGSEEGGTGGEAVISEPPVGSDDVSEATE